MNNNAFFGEPWPSGICDDGVQVPTPVGETCLWCDEEVVAGDRGSFQWAVIGGETVRKPVHRECSLRAVAGSLGHLLKACSCFKSGDDVFHDPPGLTKREAAIEVWDYITTHPGAI